MPAEPTSSSASSTSNARPSSVVSSRSWLQTPKPIRLLFSHFPIRTLPANPLPTNTISPAARRKPVLFIFTQSSSDDSDVHLIPSFNPACLKWQTYLLLHGVEFGVSASCNHASPSGSLPFLIPAEKVQETSRKETLENNEKASAGNQVKTGSQGSAQIALSQSHISTPVVASRLQSWAHEQSKRSLVSPNSEETLRTEAYLSLIDHRIRPAWLHSLYLTNNLHALIVPLYVHSSTSSSPVRLAMTHELRHAACREVLKTYPTLSSNPSQATEAIYAGAEGAFETLSSLLESGRSENNRREIDQEEQDEGWFFENKEPGVLDVSLFAYLFLLLDNKAMGGRKWAEGDTEGSLRKILSRHKNLIRHTGKLRELVYG